MKTRRGTGYYKVPSLKGVWYRSMFGHSGWCATLEDCLDPHRTRADYRPTGFKPFGAETYAVEGHLFGLDLSRRRSPITDCFSQDTLGVARRCKLSDQTLRSPYSVNRKVMYFGVPRNKFIHPNRTGRYIRNVMAAAAADSFLY